MKNQKIIPFLGENQKICAANFFAENQFVILFDSGEVILHDIAKNQNEKLFSISEFYLQNFDLQGNISIYCHSGFIVLVNDFKTHGFIFHREKNYFFPIQRGDYHADISQFPLAFFENEEKTPFLIYGTDWNRIDILNIDNLHITTADKSLIEVDAEQWRNRFYEEFPQYSSEKKPYPTPFDYFYGQILVSPKQTQFLSKGWVWGSADSLKIFDCQRFMNENRISYEFDFQAEHEDRVACWVGENAVAVGFDREIENESGIGFYNEIEDRNLELPESRFMLLIFRNLDKEFEFEKAIAVPKQVLESELYFDEKTQHFISYSQKGVLVFDFQGEVIFKENISAKIYDKKSQKFLNFDENQVEIFEINDFISDDILLIIKKLKLNYPSGDLGEDYFTVMKYLYEEMCDENLALVINFFSEKPSHEIQNDIYKVIDIQIDTEKIKKIFE